MGKAADDRAPILIPDPTSFAALQRVTFAAGDAGGFGRYHDLYGSGTTVSRVGDRFSAAVAAHRFPRLLVFDRRVAGAAHHRDLGRVRRDGFAHINLQVLRSGIMTAGVPGRERAMAPGDVVVFDTAQPQRTVVERADYVSVAVNRDAIAAAVPDVERLHGAVLPAAAAGMLGDFVLALGRNAPSLSAALASRSAGMAGEFLAGVVGDSAAGIGERDAQAETLTLHRWRAEAHIDAHLGDPLLDAARIAAVLGLSRSTLYAAFAPVNGVARRILARRLARLRARLEDPGETRTVTALAFALGFTAESHCSRAFKAAYGFSPSDVRHRARLGAAPAPAGARPDGWAAWWDAIA